MGRLFGSAAILLLCLPLAGCGEDAPKNAPAGTPLATPAAGIVEVQPSLHREYPTGDPSPLQIERDYSESEEGYVLYPKVTSGLHAEKINAAVRQRMLLFAKEQQRQIFTEYRIEMNDKGLFSIMLFIRDLQSDELLAQMPLTFDTASGELCDISYFFDPNGEEWRSALAELAEEAARESGAVLLGEIPDITDARSYYLCDQKLVLQYKLYEISTYSAGWPEFEIPVAELAPYLAQNSPLLRMIGEE